MATATSTMAILAERTRRGGDAAQVHEGAKESLIGLVEARELVPLHAERPSPRAPR
jgi:hypothetical protein